MSTTTTSPTTVTVVCPECGATITLARTPLLGEVVRCPDCGVELEVTGLAPLTVELAPQVQEDWGE
jgi:alpha-aminoadipate carrier protein LysW